MRCSASANCSTAAPQDRPQPPCSMPDQPCAAGAWKTSLAAPRLTRCWATQTTQGPFRHILAGPLRALRQILAGPLRALRQILAGARAPPSNYGRHRRPVKFRGALGPLLSPSASRLDDRDSPRGQQVLSKRCTYVGLLVHRRVFLRRRPLLPRQRHTTPTPLRVPCMVP